MAPSPTKSGIFALQNQVDQGQSQNRPLIDGLTEYKIYYGNLIGIPQTLEWEIMAMDGDERITSMFDPDIMAYYNGTSLVSYELS